MSIDPNLPEPERHALALVRTALVGTPEEWEALREVRTVADSEDLNEALVRVGASVCWRVTGGDPARLDELLAAVSHDLLANPR